MKMKLVLILLALCAVTRLSAQAIEESQRQIDPGKPDVVALDSIQTKAGQSVEMALRVIVDDTTLFADKHWAGVGSFCIPLKYDAAAMKIDSVRFKNTVAKWDEKFTNTKIDTGFVSLAGIYTLVGVEKPALVSPKEPMEIATIYIKINSNAKPGKYLIEVTKDPRQGEMYFGSIDGYHSWKPVYSAGKVIVK